MTGPTARSPLLSIRDFLAKTAPDLEVVELSEAHTTEVIAREWNVLPSQVAKTLTVRVAGNILIVVVSRTARLSNRKSKDELGGKPRLLHGADASAITGHPVGGITPLCLAAPLPVYFDIRLKDFDEVITAAGSTHAAIRIAPTRLAELVHANWVDVCDGP